MMPSATSLPAALSKEELGDLKLLDSASVADALDRFRVQSEGYSEGGLCCRYPFLLPAVGYAMTLRVRSVPSSAKGRSLWSRAEWIEMLISLPAPRVLVVQDMDRHPSAALVGYSQAAVLKTLDCVALVTNGAVRETARIDGMDFQIFSAGLSVSQAYSQAVQVGGTVQIGGLEVSPGDLLHGDQNGVVRIPSELARRVPATAAALRKKEASVIEFCQSTDFSVPGLRDLLAES